MHISNGGFVFSFPRCLIILFLLVNSLYSSASSSAFPNSVAGRILELETKGFKPEQIQRISANFEYVVSSIIEYDNKLVAEGKLPTADSLASLIKKYGEAAELQLSRKILHRIGVFFKDKENKGELRLIEATTLSFAVVPDKNGVYWFDCDSLCFTYIEVLERMFKMFAAGNPPVTILGCTNKIYLKAHMMLRWYFTDKDYIDWDAKSGNISTDDRWSCREVDPFKDKNKLDGLGVINRADIHHETGKLGEALVDCTDAIALDPDNASYYAIRALLNKTVGKYKEALADINTAIGKDEDDGIYIAGYYANRAEIKKAMNMFKEAVEDYNKAIELGPEVAYYYAGRANIEDASGKYSDAITDYTQATILNPKSAGNYFNRGNSKSKLGMYEGAIIDYSKAIEIYNEALSLYPEKEKEITLLLADCYLYRGFIEYNLKNYEAAKEDYTKVIDAYNEKLKLHPEKTKELTTTMIEYYSRRGYSEYQLQMYEEAKADYSKIIEGYEKKIVEMPTEVIANSYFTCGRIGTDLSKHEYAIVSYTKAIDICEAEIVLHPEKKTSLGSKLFECYANRGGAKASLPKPEYEDAIRDFSEAIKLAPGDAGTYANRALAEKYLGRNKDAINDYTKAIELRETEIKQYPGEAMALKPILANYYYYRGYIKKDLGDNAGALEDFKKAQAIQSNK